MKERIEQDCPLCGSPTEYHLVDYGKCKEFDCPNCSLFQVSLTAERRLQNAPQQWRDGYAQKAANAPDDHALAIRVPSVKPEPGVASVAISGKYVPIAELAQ